MSNVLILGHGFMAHAIGVEANRRGWSIRANRRTCASLSLRDLRCLISDQRVDLVINCGAYIPPSGRVFDCDANKDACIGGNVLFPQMVAQACDFAEVPLAHLSTGCLYDEAREYEETDPPLRGWDGYCGTYVGCKLLAEKLVLEYPKTYVLRLRLPFDNLDHPRNYLSKIAAFPTIFDHTNSLTHRGDFAKAALDLFELGAGYGIYHITNPGFVSAEGLVMMMAARSLISRFPEIKPSSEVKGTKLSTKKLLAAGVKIRSVEEAVADALDNWSKR